MEVGERAVQVLRGGRVEPRDRLIEDQQLPRRAQGAREQHALLLPAGELAVAAVLQLKNPELAEIHKRPRLLGGGIEEAAAARAQKAREHDLAHRRGEVLLRARLLRQIADGAAAQGRVELDAAPQGLDQSQQALKQRRLARAVFADDAEVFAAADLQIQVLPDGAPLIAQRDVPAGE